PLLIRAAQHQFVPVDGEAVLGGRRRRPGLLGRHALAAGADDGGHRQRHPELELLRTLECRPYGLGVSQVELARVVDQQPLGALGAVADRDAGRVRNFLPAAQAVTGFTDRRPAAEQEGPAGPSEDDPLQLAAGEPLLLHKPARHLDYDSFIGLVDDFGRQHVTTPPRLLREAASPGYNGNTTNRSV